MEKQSSGKYFGGRAVSLSDKTKLFPAAANSRRAAPKLKEIQDSSGARLRSVPLGICPQI